MRSAMVGSLVAPDIAFPGAFGKRKSSNVVSFSSGIRQCPQTYCGPRTTPLGRRTPRHWLDQTPELATLAAVSQPTAISPSADRS
jgi:hypothetical protein